ncbi:tRNA glutamyl-Q(34) synthetase GluQRS [Pararhodobacter sp. SW119]|uniref:tRNA glutamyl-Q(34) synthetase GluQRS n=1 Tax=Pararhodobacter sp. SW119 TaxID=2780075 RepID=UPI001AE0BF78|nr:tRNA glutamyl-Q(34) synthetase GluQRS [Pararhodobacter sp. SW119]
MAGLITRFAPSPTGPLHLGHAFSALIAWDLAQASGGTFLLRIEDIDTARCKPEWEAAIFDDLRWLGLDWPEPVMRQSDRAAAHAQALARLSAMGLTYRCICTRSDIRAALSAPQEGAPAHGPDGPVYPGTCRQAGHSDSDAAVRLDMAAAMARVGGLVSFHEAGPIYPGRHVFDTAQMVGQVGDIVLARRDIGSSYHLAVVVDDAVQGVSLVPRGADLFAATAIHVLLQRLLDLPVPDYHHHRLIRDAAGQRLAKRDDARALSLFRAQGLAVDDIRALVGPGSGGVAAGLPAQHPAR